MKLAKVYMPEGAWLVSEFHELPTVFTDFVDAEVGSKFTVEIVEMTDAEYEALPDYEP